MTDNQSSITIEKASQVFESKIGEKPRKTTVLTEGM